MTEEKFDTLETVDEVATTLDTSPIYVELAWLIAHPDVTAPVAGPRTISQLDSNPAAADLHLDSAQFKTLDEAAPAPY